MRKAILVISVVSLLALTAAATGGLVGPGDVQQTVTSMAAATDAVAYTSLRNQLLDGASSSELEILATDGGDWRVRAAADAAAGWLAHGDLYTAFVATPPVPNAAGIPSYRPQATHDDRLTPLLVEMVVWTETDDDRRTAAVGLLQRLRDARASEALAWALVHDDARGVGMSAADALARTDDPAATGLLVGALSDVADPELRAAVVGAIGWRKDASAAPSLTEVLAGDECAPCRALAARSLGWLRDPSSTGLLVTALQSDSDAEVRGAAALALGKIGGAAARAALEVASSADPDPEVVRLSAAALDRLD